jgi:microcystin-dependent protein
MPSPFLGEIKIMSFVFPPRGWALCNGQFMQINQNQALFALLGTMYGGNGQTTFALPDLRGRVPMHLGSGFTQGQAGGQTSHTVTVSELPAHNHFVTCTQTAGDSVIPTGRLLANANLNAYAQQNPAQPIEPATISNVGGSQPHNNMSPYLVLSFCIALQGIFPSQN